jgi:hypothetical protein
MPLGVQIISGKENPCLAGIVYMARVASQYKWRGSSENGAGPAKMARASENGAGPAKMARVQRKWRGSSEYGAGRAKMARVQRKWRG